MPGTGKYSGKEYRGHLRPSGKLTAQQFAEMTDARLREVWDALNDAYDMDMMEGILMHNVDGSMAEMKRRGMWA